MKFVRHALAAGASIVVMLSGSLASASEQTSFPNKHVTIVVPFAAGGGTDAIARTIGRALSDKWGQSVVVDNRTGADGVVGTQRVLQQPADGYTMLIQLNSMLLYDWLHKSAGINVLNDLEPISKIQESPLVITVNSAHPANNLQELFDHCKKTGKCSYGTATANGKLVGRQLEEIAGTSMAAIPYKGTSAMVSDLLGGHLEIAMLSANLATPMLNDGKIKAFAVGTKDRFKSLPNVPTFLQASGQNINGTTWYGLFVKAGTPPEIIKKIERDLMEIAGDEKILATINAQGATPLFTNSENFRKDLQQEYSQVAVIADKVF